MSGLKRTWISGALGVCLLWAPLALAQQTSTDDLKKDIQALQESLKAIQKDIQDIKALLTRPAPPPSGVGVVIDLGTNAFKGERTAKLTLVEFSDYQ